MTMPFLAQALAPPSILLRSPPSVWLLGLSLPELRRKHWHYHPNACQPYRNQPGSAADLRYQRQAPTSWQIWRSRTPSPPVNFSSPKPPQKLDRQIIPYAARAGALWSIADRQSGNHRLSGRTSAPSRLRRQRPRQHLSALRRQRRKRLPRQLPQRACP
jgi:hypothetical protein